MDIAVGQASGGPLAQGAEECRCPQGQDQDCQDPAAKSC